MYKHLFRHLYLSIRRSSSFENMVIAKSLSLLKAMIMIVIFIAVGFVIDEILFEIGVDDWAGIIVGVIGVGFIADFCYRFWEVDNKLMFFSGYATLPISRRKMLWLSILLNVMSEINFAGVLLFCPTLIHASLEGLITTLHTCLFVSMIFVLALFNNAVVNYLKSFDTNAMMLRAGVAFVLYLSLGYLLVKSDNGEFLSISAIVLLAIVLLIAVVGLAIEYSNAKKMFYNLSGAAPVKVSWSFLQGRGNMFPILLYLRQKGVIFWFFHVLISCVMLLLLCMREDTSIKSILFIVSLFSLMNILAFVFSPFTINASEYLDGLLTAEKQFVKRMLYVYDRIFSVSSVIIATILALLMREYLLVFSFLIFSIMVVVPLLSFDVFLITRNRMYYTKTGGSRKFDIKGQLFRISIYSIFIALACIRLYFGNNVLCTIMLLISIVGLIHRQKMFDFASDRYWKNRHKILERMREG